MPEGWHAANSILRAHSFGVKCGPYCCLTPLLSTCELIHIFVFKDGKNCKLYWKCYIAIQNLVAWATRHSGFGHPCYTISYSLKIFVNGICAWYLKVLYYLYIVKTASIYRVWGSCSCVGEDHSLLGYGAVSVREWLPTTQWHILEDWNPPLHFVRNVACQYPSIML